GGGRSGVGVERALEAGVGVETGEGPPAAGVSITVLSSVRGLEPDEPVSTVTDSRGEAAYVYRRLETTVRVQSPGHVTLSLPAETPRMAVRLRPGIAMDGVVTAPDGSPVPACRVRLESPSLVSPASAITDETGRQPPGVPGPG